MKPILLLHGALGAAVQLEPLSRELAGKYAVHILEFAGHGNTPSDAAFSIDGFVEQLREYLDARQLKNIVVFGYSMGGYVALKLASRHPEYFEKIITLGTKFNWTPESAEREVQFLNPEKIELKVPAYASMLAGLHSASSWKTVMQKTAEMMLRLGNGEAMTNEDFEKIQTPCCLGLGDEDKMVSLEETQHIAKLIPNSGIEILENTPHPIDKVDSQVLADLILNHTATYRS